MYLILLIICQFLICPLDPIQIHNYLSGAATSLPLKQKYGAS